MNAPNSLLGCGTFKASNYTGSIIVDLADSDEEWHISGRFEGIQKVTKKDRINGLIKSRFFFVLSKSREEAEVLRNVSPKALFKGQKTTQPYIGIEISALFSTGTVPVCQKVLWVHFQGQPRQRTSIVLKQFCALVGGMACRLNPKVARQLAGA